MARPLITDEICARRLRVFVCALCAVLACGCAAGARPDAAGPPPDEPPFPIFMKTGTGRRGAALAPWDAPAREQKVPKAPAPPPQPTAPTPRRFPIPRPA